MNVYILADSGIECNKIWWTMKELNFRTSRGTDLQSAAFTVLLIVHLHLKEIYSFR